jgi:hypothetical protein
LWTPLEKVGHQKRKPFFFFFLLPFCWHNNKQDAHAIDFGLTQALRTPTFFSLTIFDWTEMKDENRTEEKRRGGECNALLLHSTSYGFSFLM